MKRIFFLKNVCFFNDEKLIHSCDISIRLCLPYLIATQIQVSQLIQQIVKLRVDILQSTASTFQRFQILRDEKIKFYAFKHV
jgi:hypothetical protein